MMVSILFPTLFSCARTDVSYSGTIVSIQENHFPNRRGVLSSKEHTILSLMRRNLLNIFQQLSKANDGRRRENHIMTIPVRPGVQGVTSNEISSSDSPSLLFHYLFDDWLTSYSLVARKEHQYGVQLEHLVSSTLFFLILLTTP